MAQEKDQRFVEAGRRGGLIGGAKGGKARHEHLTPEERAEVMRRVAQARWAWSENDCARVVTAAARQMLDQIAKDGKPQRLYYSGQARRAWHVPAGYLEEARWERHWIGNYGRGSNMKDVMDDFMSDVSRLTKP